MSLNLDLIVTVHWLWSSCCLCISD